MNKFKKEKGKALSTTDIFDIARKTCNVLKYPDLQQFDSIDDLFEESSSDYQLLRPQYDFDDNTCILLYMSRPNFGHWCSITRKPDNAHDVPSRRGGTRLDFLDPYGTIIDDQLDFINPKFRHESSQDQAYLCKLLSDFDGEVHYNNIPLQKLDGKTSTCGRYAALFLKYNQIPVEKFANSLKKASIKHKIPVDDIVAMMTVG
jgi:hypothetical protein